MSECLDHGLKGSASGYATGWVRVDGVGTSQIHRVIRGVHHAATT